MELLNNYFNKARQVYAEPITLEQYFENYNSIVNAESEIKEFLKSKTVKVLKNVYAQLGGWNDSRKKKADYINSIFDSITDYFLIGRPISYTIGECTHAEAKSKLINGTSLDVLKSFQADRVAKQSLNDKALSNPETLEEFNIFIRKNGKDQLNAEQLARYEGIRADITLKNQERQQQRDAVVNKIDIENVEFALHETKHSKTGADIFTVLMENRVAPNDFKELRIKAKQIGGYYSRYTNLNITPQVKAGFNFDTKDKALSFMNLKTDNVDTSEAQKEVKQRKVLTVSERLKQRAESIITKNEAILSQDRKTNTHRRIAQAASIEQKAEKQIVFAKKLLKIAQGFDNGSIKYLHALNNGKQLEQLEHILYGGFYTRTKGIRQSESIREPYNDVNFIEYPYPLFGVSVLNNLVLPHIDRSGCKLAAKRILKYAKSYAKNEYVTITSTHIMKDIKIIASNIRDVWNKDRLLDPIKNYERIYKMGLINLDILKTALRELIALSEGTEMTAEQKAAKEMKQLERSFATRKIDGFFPTPDKLIDNMFSMARVFEGETILEPSAGMGHIADRIRDKYPLNDLSCIEFNYDLWKLLNKKGYDAEHENFLTTSHKYDVIFMNPPFERHQDIDHVLHAFDLLKDGGRLVAIMAGNKSEDSNNSTVKSFMNTVNEYGYIVQNESASFKNAFRSTNVNTVTVYLEKPKN